MRIYPCNWNTVENNPLQVVDLLFDFQSQLQVELCLILSTGTRPMS